MKKDPTPIRLSSILLIVIGVVLMTATIFVKGALNIALPLVFIVLGIGFIFLVLLFKPQHGWASYLFIPAFLLIAFGIIFLLNILTGDWNSWAYAWLLLLSAIGVGILFANRDHQWPPFIKVVGLGMAALGITFFALFGAITGGLLIQIIAPVILVAAGLILYRVDPEKILPGSVIERFPSLRRKSAYFDQSRPVNLELVEELSSRELEVLKLIEQGMTNQQIAVQLTVAESTVKTHIDNIYGKLGIKTRAQAIKRSHELGLFEK